MDFEEWWYENKAILIEMNLSPAEEAWNYQQQRIEALEAEKERILELAWKAAATLRNDRYADRVRHALQHLDEVEDE